MIRPLKWLRRSWERYQQAPRKNQLSQELAEHFKCAIALKPASTKGGYDQIYLAQSGKEIVAVVRVNNPHKVSTDPIGPEDPAIPLGNEERLNREWQAYETLSPHGLSPRPLWRCQDAIACSWLDWKRLSTQMTNPRLDPIAIQMSLFSSIRRMHDLGITHLDLNLGNFLIRPGATQLAVIDFEFGPVNGIDSGQQMAFDYLKIIQDSLRPRRGYGRLMPSLNDWMNLITQHIHPSASQASLPFVPRVLPRLYDHPEIVKSLRAIFSRLPDAMHQG
ncbi:MAG: lipopolysaccharide kinase InaA family protein [Limisphaerales bacterium]|jgi:serine/threonine protein kinase